MSGRERLVNLLTGKKDVYFSLIFRGYNSELEVGGGRGRGGPPRGRGGRGRGGPNRHESRYQGGSRHQTPDTDERVKEGGRGGYSGRGTSFGPRRERNDRGDRSGPPPRANQPRPPRTGDDDPPNHHSDNYETGDSAKHSKFS